LDTARLRSGFTLQDSLSFAERIEKMLRLSAGVPVDEAVEEEPELEPDVEEDEEVEGEGEQEQEELEAAQEAADHEEL